MATIPAISIVIPTLNGAARLPRTLSALERCRNTVDCEILVVDDGSTDGSAHVGERFSAGLPLRVLCHDRNRGRSAARNTGIREAAAAVVLLLDDDMEADADLLTRHLEAHDGTAPTAAIGRIVTDGLDPKIPFQAFLLREDEWRRERLRKAPLIAFGEIATGQLSVGRESALAAGLFDEEIGRYGLEDIEFAYRLWQAGVRFVYLDEAVTRHEAYATALERYCERHRMVGEVAVHLANRHDTPEMREYLRMDPVQGNGKRSLFTRLMDGSAAVLRRPRAAEWLASPMPQSILRGGIRALEKSGARRPLGFAYSLMRDIQYFSAMGSARRRELYYGGDW